MTTQVAQNTLIDRRRHECRQKRGGRCLVIDTVFDLETIPARRQSEDDEGAEKEFYEFLRLEHFRQPLFWPLVTLRLEGLSVQQAAEVLGRSRQAMYAQFRLMRKLWNEFVSLSEAGKRARAKMEEGIRWKLLCDAMAERDRHVEARRAAGLTAR